ncbi:hypothetical protein FHW94_003193 [Novosphingobium sp. SG720]|nr:hypothetical protein [Novosphingobium sp. SG720]
MDDYVFPSRVDHNGHLSTRLCSASCRRCWGSRAM